MKGYQLFLHGFVLVAATVMALPAASAKDIVVQAGHLIDGVSQTARNNVSILIHDDRITAVEPGFVKPEGADVIDLSHLTVLPGLIDCHVHINDQFDGGNPVADTTQLEYVQFVMKGGVIYKMQGQI